MAQPEVSKDGFIATAILRLNRLREPLSEERKIVEELLGTAVLMLGGKDKTLLRV